MAVMGVMVVHLAEEDQRELVGTVMIQVVPAVEVVVDTQVEVQDTLYKGIELMAILVMTLHKAVVVVEALPTPL
jgi:hypothetical protein